MCKVSNKCPELYIAPMYIHVDEIDNTQYAAVAHVPSTMHPFL